MENLIKLMDKINSSGAFSASGTLSPTLPGLKVKDIGHVGLPLSTQQAQALIELSEQAPFGRREETIVDTDVRKSWQISAEDFELTNPQWEEALQAAVDQIGRDLGLAGCKIGFEQYKLLVYEEGCFFAPHRDTEKIPNMFATLVVNLPSEHEGGELIISHAGQSQHYSFADSSLFEPSFVAFYADCYHEVKPITSGYRLCLVYNLAITNREQQPALTQQLEVVADVEKAIQSWTQELQDTPILTYLLDHSYSEQNLNLSNLKLDDFAKTSVLLSAAANSNCQAYVCLVTYHQESYGEVNSYGYKGDLDESDFEEYDVNEEEIYAHAFVAADGSKIEVEKLNLDEDQLLSKTPLRKGPGREYAISEATGNEGATKYLWYHRGAVIMWPKERELDLAARMDVGYGIHVLKRSLQGSEELEVEARQPLIRLANHILDSRTYFHKVDIYDELIKLGDLELLKKSLFKRISSWSFAVEPIALIKVAEKLGWHHFADDVQARLNVEDGMRWLDSLLQTNQAISNEGLEVITRWVNSRCKRSLTAITQSLQASPEPLNVYQRRSYHHDQPRSWQQTRSQYAEIMYLMRLSAYLNLDEVAQNVIARLADYSDRKFLTDTYGPAVVESLNVLKKRDHNQVLAQKFADAVRQHIQAEFSAPPEPPQDWSRSGQLACGCEFCSQVNEFLPKPELSSMGINQTLKRNLVHVEMEIEKQEIDAEIQIQKKKSKFDGTIKKNQSQYKQQLELYQAAQEIVKKLPS